MSNITITNNDTGSVGVENEEFKDDLLTLAGPDSIAAGTILARDSSTLKLVLYVKGGVSNDNGIPKAVLTYQVDSATSGAHDVAVRGLVGGKVNKDRLIIDADGDGSNVDNAVLDELRDFGITPVSTQQLAQIDNPQP